MRIGKRFTGEDAEPARKASQISLKRSARHDGGWSDRLFPRMASDLALAVLLATFLAPPLTLTITSPAAAQAPSLVQNPIFWRGDAVVTGFSGVIANRSVPGADPNEHVKIDRNGPVLQVFDMSHMATPANAPLIKAPRTFSVPARLIGQVFGLALDDGQPPLGAPINPDPVPNIYAAATSSYGLHLIEAKRTPQGVTRKRSLSGSPNAQWMDGQFGTALGGGPGSIWKINGRTGEASLFANVALAKIKNTGAGLGALAFDRVSRQIFVSDMQTGIIFAYDLAGRQTDQFDHGLTGRVAAGVAPVPFDPATRADIRKSGFSTADPTSWGFTDWERLVRGIAIHGRRLYYATDAGPDIWSVGLTPKGRFAGDPHFEFAVKTTSGDPVTSLKFARNGTLYLSQRGQSDISDDLSVLTTQGSASVLRYRRQRQQNGKMVWREVPDEYAIGKRPGHRSTNGGIALGYGYDRDGYIRYDTCDATLWTTGEMLRDSDANRRKALIDNTNVHGLQGNSVAATLPTNQPPDEAWYLDYDGVLDGANRRGHMGDVSIWGCTPGQKAIARPDIRISKSCLSAGLGGFLHCTVELVNRGTEAPRGPVGFTDNANIQRGPYHGAFPQVVNVNADGHGWSCSSYPAPTLACQIDGNALRPGHRRSIEVVMDVAGMVETPGVRVRNCATLLDRSRTACVSPGADLVISKSGPAICVAGDLCTFDLSVTNQGRSTFDGAFELVDVISIPGIDALTVAWVSPPLPGCDPGIIPFECVTPVVLGPGGTRNFAVTVDIPANAVAPGGAIVGRNCLVGADASLLNIDPSARTAFQHLTGQATNPSMPLTGVGHQCTEFTIISPPTHGPGPIARRNPACPIPVAEMVMTPTPGAFTRAGDRIHLAIDISNTGTGPAEFIGGWNVHSPELPSIICTPSDPAFMPQTVMNCDAEYVVTPADMVGGKIVIGATFDGNSTCGAIAPVNADIEMTEANPAVTVGVVQSPPTINWIGQPVTITTTVSNTGNVSVTVTPTILINGQSTTLSTTTIGPRGKVQHTNYGTVTATDLKTGIVTKVSVTGATATGKPLPTTLSLPATSTFVPAVPGQTGFIAPPLTLSVPGQAGNLSYVLPTLVPAVPGQTGGPGFATGPFVPAKPGQTGRPGYPPGTFVPAVRGQTGWLSNAASVAPASATGTATAPPASMSLEYTCNPKTYASANQPIGCVFTIVNTGTVDIMSCEINGNRMNVPCPQGVIQPGATIYAQGFYLSTAADIGKNIVLDFTLSGTPGQ